VSGKRIELIDFWRGAVLAAIFINHIPGNILGNFTPRNYGFSDAAEDFVFLSGISVALAGGRRFRTAPAWTAARGMASRALRLYAMHVLLTFLALALFGAAALLTGEETFLAEHGRATLFADPLRGLLGVATLGHQIGYFNILPLYVVLIIFAPLLLHVGLRNRWGMIALSASVYGVARLTGANLPSWPEGGVWFFNPLTWQFMFTLGIFTGLLLQNDKFPVRAAPYRLAVTFTIVSALIVSNFLGCVPEFVAVVDPYLDRGKTDLGVIRIIDFLALAYTIYGSGVSARLKSTAIFPVMSRLGRHSLAVFSAGSLLSASAQIFNATVTSTPFSDIVIVLAGLWTLHKLASFLECASRPAQPAAPAANLNQTEELSFTR